MGSTDLNPFLCTYVCMSIVLECTYVYLSHSAPPPSPDPVEQLRDNPALMEYKEPQPVGLELVERVHKDPAAPHAAFKCTMCECFFNDDNARMLHCKGRRHRLNYKVGWGRSG